MYLGLLTISYVNNAALERQIESSSATLLSAPPPNSAMASTEQLRLLDGLRERLLQLEDYRRHGAPILYRWGLYRGNLLLTPTRRIYFAHFRTLLLNRTQSNLLATLDALPAAPPAGAEYNGIYNALRGYLITTSNPEKSTPAFLTPVLLKFWQNNASADAADQATLAQRQFDFYADELPLAPPFTIAPAAPSVAHTRAYLNSFGGIERIYQSMLTAAEKAGPPINFNAQHPRSDETGGSRLRPLLQPRRAALPGALPTGSHWPLAHLRLTQPAQQRHPDLSRQGRRPNLANTDATRQFNWSAQTATSAGLTANNLPLTFTGPWSVFQLFAKAKSQKTGSAYDLSFPLEVADTPGKGPDGTPVVAHFELSGPGADIPAPGALHCVPNVASR